MIYSLHVRLYALVLSFCVCLLDINCSCLIGGVIEVVSVYFSYFSVRRACISAGI